LEKYKDSPFSHAQVELCSNSSSDLPNKRNPPFTFSSFSLQQCIPPPFSLCSLDSLQPAFRVQLSLATTGHSTLRGSTGRTPAPPPLTSTLSVKTRAKSGSHLPTASPSSSKGVAARSTCSTATEVSIVTVKGQEGRSAVASRRPFHAAAFRGVFWRPFSSWAKHLLSMGTACIGNHAYTSF